VVRKVETLAQQLAQQRAKVQQIQTKLSAEKRKQDTRRKILAGAMLLTSIERGQGSEEEFLQQMDAFLTRASDRELFGLPPVCESQSEESSSAFREERPKTPQKNPQKKLKKIPAAEAPEGGCPVAPSPEQEADSSTGKPEKREPSPRLPERQDREALLEQFNL
jgi:hypothetical protein